MPPIPRWRSAVLASWCPQRASFSQCRNTPLPNSKLRTEPQGAQLSALGLSALNLQAHVQPSSVGSVRFTINGALFRIENSSPYALAGDLDGNFEAWWQPVPGTYTITITPFSGSNATGIPGITRTLTLILVD